MSAMLWTAEKMNLEYVLKHEIDRNQCPVCLGIWFRFNHEGKLGIYRVSELEPVSCPTCHRLDNRIENDPSFLMSHERWFEV